MSPIRRRLLRAGTPALLLLLAASPASGAQEAPASAPGQSFEGGAAWESAFAPLDLSTPNLYRGADGEPGPRYWQQRADYRIQVTLDPRANTLTGRQTIRYRNNSPDSLEFVWLHLDQNRFRSGSRGEVTTPIGGRFEGRGDPGGIEVSSFRTAGSDRELERSVRDTRMRVLLERPLPPGGEATWELAWSFPIPRYGADRMGREDLAQGTVYEIAQWYPRMAVYDDVKGWNTEPYLGLGEFYLEYGDFDVEITVPRELLVAATGNLENAAEVLTGEQLRRLERARKSQQTVAIVAPEEVGAARSRPRGTSPLMWRFKAGNVRDFAWAASQAFIWDAAAWEDVLAQSFYPREALPLWSGSTQMVRESLREQSRWYRYPYPTMANVNGVVGGMEYPMIVFCGERQDEAGLWEVTNHEVGHTWFPMIVGSNERLHMWFDEGLNTFINGFATAARTGEPLSGDGTVQSLLPYLAGQEGADQPAMIRADAMQLQGFGQLAYNKPAVGLRLLREQVIGDTLLFDSAFRGYIEAWAFKHPTPDDFFRYMGGALGESLDWFWRGWFLTNAKLDQEVTGVAISPGPGGGAVSTVSIRSNGQLIFPVPLVLELEGGEKRRSTLPVEIWLRGSRFDYPVIDPKPVVGVRIDPDQALPDLDPANNGWGTLAASGPAGGPSTSNDGGRE